MVSHVHNLFYNTQCYHTGVVLNLISRNIHQFNYLQKETIMKILLISSKYLLYRIIHKGMATMMTNSGVNPTPIWSGIGHWLLCRCVCC